MTIDIDSLEAVFFDLDGTLLGISDTDFEGLYTKMIAKRFSELIEPEKFVKALWMGTEAMMKHQNPEKVVLETFFETFTSTTGIGRDETYEKFDAFYRNEFGRLEELIKPVPESRELVDTIEEKGIKIVLATNPVFPEIATRRRCSWTNLEFDEFLYVSHAENSHACKPSSNYYQRLLSIADVDPQKTLMVGNDYLYDMSAKKLGMQTWMIDEFQGNTEYKDKFTIDMTGSLAELLSLF